MPTKLPLSTRLRASLVLGVVGAVVLGCSTTQWDTSAVDSPPPSTVKEYTRDQAGVRESLVDHLATVGTNLNEWAAPREQAECAADKIVQAIGVDRLLELGYEPSDGSLGLPYTADESTAMLNILTNCIDFEQGFLEMMSAYQKLDIDSSRCVASGLDRLGLIRDLAEGLLRGSEPDPFANDNRLAANTTRVMTECLGMEDLLPLAPQTEFPQDVDETTTTRAPTASGGEGDDDEGGGGDDDEGPASTSTTSGF